MQRLRLGCFYEKLPLHLATTRKLAPVHVLEPKLSDSSTSQVFAESESPAPLLYSVHLHKVLSKTSPCSPCRKQRSRPFPQEFLGVQRREYKWTYLHIVVHAHPQQVLQKVPVLPAPWGWRPRARKGAGIGSYGGCPEPHHVLLWRGCRPGPI